MPPHARTRILAHTLQLARRTASCLLKARTCCIQQPLQLEIHPLVRFQTRIQADASLPVAVGKRRAVGGSAAFGGNAQPPVADACSSRCAAGALEDAVRVLFVRRAIPRAHGLRNGFHPGGKVVERAEAHGQDFKGQQRHPFVFRTGLNALNALQKRNLRWLGWGTIRRLRSRLYAHGAAVVQWP